MKNSFYLSRFWILSDFFGISIDKALRGEYNVVNTDNTERGAYRWRRHFLPSATFISK